MLLVGNLGLLEIRLFESILLPLHGAFLPKLKYFRHKIEIKFILMKQKENFAWACIAMIIIVIFLLMEKNHINPKQIIKMSTFHLNFLGTIFSKCRGR